MRLAELHPELDLAGGGRARLSFDCPVHGPGLGEFPDRVSIPISTPLDPSGPHLWGWNGETDFEKLAIAPSVNFHGHWHGHVTNGEVSTV